MKAYSATRTATATKCTMKWALQQEGWQPNIVTAKDPAACLGTAFHAGAEYLMQRLKLGTLGACDLEAAQAEARESLIKTAGAVYNSGRTIKPDVESELDALPIRVTNAVKCLYESRSLLDLYEVVEVEFFMENEGRTTADLVLREKATGHVGILDWKCKTFQRSYYKSQFISDFEQSWQLKHYCWAYTHHTGEPVDFFLLGLMDVTTKPKLELYPFSVNEVDMMYWEEAAAQMWSTMTAIELGQKAPTQVANCRDQYGRCEFWNMCYLHQYRSTAEVEYSQEKNQL